MAEQQAQTKPEKNGLPGILKFAIMLAVIVVAILAILLLTNTISRAVFNDYLMTLLGVIVIGTVAAALISMLSGPGKSD